MLGLGLGAREVFATFTSERGELELVEVGQVGRHDAMHQRGLVLCHGLLLPGAPLKTSNDLARGHDLPFLVFRVGRATNYFIIFGH